MEQVFSIVLCSDVRRMDILSSRSSERFLKFRGVVQGSHLNERLLKSRDFKQEPLKARNLQDEMQILPHAKTLKFQPPASMCESHRQIQLAALAQALQSFYKILEGFQNNDRTEAVWPQKGNSWARRSMEDGGSSVKYRHGLCKEVQRTSQ